MVCHNEICEGVADLISKAFTPTHMHDDHKIYTFRSVCGWKYKLKGSPSNYEGELKGDLLIIDLFMVGTDSIKNMRVMNTDATSYQSKTSEKFLETAEK